MAVQMTLTTNITRESSGICVGAGNAQYTLKHGIFSVSDP